MVGKGRFFVGGNWKCNETVDQVKKLVTELNAGDVPDDIEIVVAPTYIHLAMVRTHACPALTQECTCCISEALALRYVRKDPHWQHSICGRICSLFTMV